MKRRKATNAEAGYSNSQFSCIVIHRLTRQSLKFVIVLQNRLRATVQIYKVIGETKYTWRV